jgi:hypothetical protein
LFAICHRRHQRATLIATAANVVVEGSVAERNHGTWCVVHGAWCLVPGALARRGTRHWAAAGHLRFRDAVEPSCGRGVALEGDRDPDAGAAARPPAFLLSDLKKSEILNPRPR